MDAITLLRQDHQTVERLFKRFEKAGDHADAEKRQIVDRIIEELSIHASIEELVFYPVVRATVPNAEDITLESLEEHHIVKWLLSELDGMDPQHERFDAKVTVLMENVRHHVEEEHDDLFPTVRDSLSRTALNDLGRALAEAKQSAPTHPHPRSPDTPPGNAIVGAVTGVVDRVGDNLSGITQGGVTVVKELIARITGGDGPSAPTGTGLARSRAVGVRSRVDDATRRARDTGKAATAGARATAASASSGLQAVATTTKRAASTTGATAKRAGTSTKRAATPTSAATKATATKATATKATATKATATKATATKAAPTKVTAKRGAAKQGAAKQGVATKPASR